MNSEPAPATLRLALVSMPWPLFNRPSIQLGALKGYLRQELPQTTVTLLHPYLDAAHRLSPAVYEAIARKMWLAEALFTPLAFPEQNEPARRFAQSEGRRIGLSKTQVDNAFHVVAGFFEDFLAATDWNRYDLVGFSVSFNQLSASLAAAKAIKANHPKVAVVFGGASLLPGAGTPLKEAVGVDHVICGEGEQRLADLCRALLAGAPASPQPSAGPSQLANLARLPAPDYTDYFREMAARFGAASFLPTIPIELSRGCWWGKCAFCNLNRQWTGYRRRPMAAVLNEIAAQSEQHAVLDFAFTDNVLPVKEGRRLFTALGKRRRDLRFFAELRTVQLQEAAIYRQGGLGRVQVGIEALSDSLLSRMGKGSTVMDNILAMKSALTQGIRLEGNLILEFPQSTDREVADTLDALEFVFPFPPLAGAAFFLGSGSPVDVDPRRFGIRAITTHPGFLRLYPPSFAKKMPFLIHGYRGDRQAQRQRWRPVREKLRAWNEFHRNRKKDAAAEPLLTFRDGGDFLLIRQELADGRILHHRLRGASRRIYLALSEPTSTQELALQFSTIQPRALTDFLADLVGKRLVYTDKTLYLALAVTEPARGNA